MVLVVDLRNQRSLEPLHPYLGTWHLLPSQTNPLPNSSLCTFQLPIGSAAPPCSPPLLLVGVRRALGATEPPRRSETADRAPFGRSLAQAATTEGLPTAESGVRVPKVGGQVPAVVYVLDLAETRQPGCEKLCSS